MSSAAAIPASAVKAWPGRAVILRPVRPVILRLAFTLDHLRRPVARQEAVTVPMAAHVTGRLAGHLMGHLPFLGGGRRLLRRGCGGRGQKQTRGDGDQP